MTLSVVWGGVREVKGHLAKSSSGQGLIAGVCMCVLNVYIILIFIDINRHCEHNFIF